MTQTFTFRLTAEGVQQLEQQLQSLGSRGQAAFTQLQAAAASAGASIGGAGGGAAAGGRGLGGGNFQQGMQQAGFQIQDFIVQLQSGQSAFVAFAQQGSQLASGFAGGLAGLGVAAAAMAAQFFFAGQAGKQAADQTKLLEEALFAVNLETANAEERQRLLNEKRREGLVDTLNAVRAEQFLEAARLRAASAADRALIRAGDAAQAPQGLAADFGIVTPGTPGTVDFVNAQERLKRLEELEAEIAKGNAAADLIRDFEFPSGSAQATRPARVETERLTESLDDVLARLRDKEASRAYLDTLKEAERITESVRTADERYADTLANLNRLRDAGVLSAETYGRAVKQADEQLERADGSARRAADAARQLGLAFSSAFEDAIVRGESLSDVLTGLGQDFARLVVRQTVTEPLAGAARDALGSLDLGSLFGSIFGGARANGGPVSAGRAYLVGERGPEIMLAGASGTVVPNEALGGGVTVNQSFDLRGADASAVALLRAEAGRIKAETMAAIADATRRGGAYSRAIRGR